jgi:hypothetical protein
MRAVTLLRLGHVLSRREDGTVFAAGTAGDVKVSEPAVQLLIEQRVLGKRRLKPTRKGRHWIGLAGPRKQPVLRVLKIGEPVRVYRSSAAAALWFCDPETGKPVQFSMNLHVSGKVRSRTNDCYEVTVLCEGRELYLSAGCRHWVRTPSEPGPLPGYW